MKNFTNLCTLALAVGLVSAAGLRADPIQDGKNAYAKGDYPAAVSAFQTALSAHGPSAALYYNLASAQLKAGERPAAALSLRRALMIDPDLADARVSLSEIERSQGIPAVSDDWRAMLVQKASLSALLVAGAVVFWLGAFWLLRAVTKKSRKLISVILAAAFLLLGGALCAAAILADPKVFDRHSGVVLAGEAVPLLSAPADSSALVTRLPPASHVRILGRSGEWTYCETPSGEKGWLPSVSVEAVVPAA